ncbi:hypothetical protein [Herbaspirillum rubrisubalbicans]|uniref:Uncharacterized protein n=1 Tax=Herbaspirillum rubrisubalbicans TaxID=80842 RepID=A0AAD0XHH3_9BURK|nr:hypothetical protein [Herbaspirillum rubrisubalbicans]AYR24545.1 hypothetical protein RC54_12205 [Herbaspirillum rubrisubalbicans]
MSDSNSDSSNKSETTTTNNTTYEDKRNVASEGAVAVSGDGNTVTNSYQTTDLGAVQAGVTLAGNVATKALDLTNTGLAGVLDAMKASATANKEIFDQTLKLVGDNTKDTKEAFVKATEEVNGNRVLVGMGVIAIGFALAKGAYK